MRILHYKPTIRLEEGGVVRAVLDLCTELARAGHEITLATCDAADAPPEWSEGGPGLPRILPLERPSRPGGRFAPRQLPGLARALEEADVAHLHAVWQPTNLQVARLARSLDTPYVVSVHGMLDDWTIAQKHLKKRLYLALGGSSFLANAAIIHTTAEAEWAQARRWTGHAPGEVVPLMFDLDGFRELPGPGPALARFPQIDRAVPRLLFLSRIHYKKGVDRLIRACALLRERGVPFQCLIAGTGDEAYTRQMHELRDGLGLDERVAFLGFVSGVEKVSLYQASSLFVLPTSQENFGFVYFEALASACPVVTTRGTDTWPEIESSGAGLITGEDPASIAAAVEQMLGEGEEELRARAAHGREWTLAHLDPQRIIGAYESLYRRAAKEP